MLNAVVQKWGRVGFYFSRYCSCILDFTMQILLVSFLALQLNYKIWI